MGGLGPGLAGAWLVLIGMAGEPAIADPVGVVRTRLQARAREPKTLDLVLIYRAERNRSDRAWRFLSARLGLERNDPAAERALGVYHELIPSDGVDTNGGYSGYLANLAKAAGAMGTEEKLALLSLLGSLAARGYEKGRSPDSESVSPASIYANAVAGGKSGGLCRDIAAFLAESAKAAGFTSVGLHTLVSGTEKRQGHAISHFRDPATGQIYSQNYGAILATGTARLDEAIDASTAFNSVMTDVSWVEGAPGHVNAYRPANSRWIDRQLDRAASFDADWAVVSGEIGNRERNVVARLVGSPDLGESQGFLLHADRQSPEGLLQVDAVGLSGRLAGKVGLGFASELGAVVSGEGGYLRHANPAYKGRSSRTIEESLFASARFTGIARYHSTSGQLSIEAESRDLQPGVLGWAPSGWWNETLVGMFQELPFLSGWLGLERGFRFQPRAVADAGWGPGTAYDRASLVIDGRGSPRAGYLAYRGEVYALEGIERASALGLRSAFRAVLPPGALGEIAIVLDASAIARNRFDDPLLEGLPSVSIGPDWSRCFGESVETGASARIGNGRAPAALLWGEAKDAQSSGRYTGSVWVRLRF